MASVADIHEIGYRTTETTVNVPNCAVAHLMFYLHCIEKLITSKTATLKKLTDFRNWRLLNNETFTTLLMWCVVFGPENLIGKCIFQNEEACGDNDFSFYEVSKATTNTPATNSDATIGQRIEKRYIMFYKTSFLKQIYYIPMIYYSNEVDIIKGGIADIERERAITQDGCSSGKTRGNTFSPSRSASAATRSSCCNIL